MLRGYLRSETIGPLPFRRLAAAHPDTADAVLQKVLRKQDTASGGDESRLDDASLRAARYLARRLLAALLDCPPGEVPQRLPTNP